MSKEKRKMKFYTITIPVTASIAIMFESEELLTNSEVFEIAVNEFSWTLQVEKSDNPFYPFDLSINDWQSHRHIMKGNVFYGVQSDYDVEVEDTEDSDDNVEDG
jgi:hypothetical protein